MSGSVLMMVSSLGSIPCQFQVCSRQERFLEVFTVTADYEEFHFWIVWFSGACQARRFAILSAPKVVQTT